MNKFSAAVIFASPHSGGNCSRILSSFLDKIKLPLDIQTFNAYNLSPLPCIDCGYCKSTEQCAFHDLDELFSSIESCDLLIIVSPVYNMSFPSPMKAILDRFQRYFNARFSMNIRPAIKKHRKAVLLSAAGSDKETGDILIQQLQQSFSVMNTDLIAHAVINGLDNSPFNADDEKIIHCAIETNRSLSTF